MDIAPDLTQYDPGSTVTLTASPAANSDFVGWQGDVPAGQENENPLTLTLDANKSLTAVFMDKQTQFNLTTQVAPAGGGSVTRNPDAASYSYGSLVELTATPAAGYRFVNWSGDVTGTARTVTVMMNSDKNVTANFALIPRFTLLLTRKGEGTLTATPESGDSTYEMGTLVTLEAVEADGWYFAGWFDGVSTDTAPTQEIQIYEDLNIQGTFKPLPSGKKHLTLLVDPTVGGTVTPNPSSPDGLYDDNTTVTLTATPAGGYVFEEWTGDASGTTTETQVVMSANRTVTGRFVLISQQKHTLTLLKKGDGTVTPNPASADGKYTQGTVVTVTATPGAGSAFVGWLGDVPPLMEQTNPLQITLDADKTLMADFDKRSTVTYPLTVLFDGTGFGGVTRNPAGTVFSAGTTVTLAAVPDSDSVFGGWTGDVPTTQALVNPILVTMDSTKTITARFDPDGFCDLVVLAENGTVNVSPDGTTFPRGTTVTLTATPTPGYRFTGWSGSATGTLNPLTINMNTNKTIRANFALDEYVLNLESENGTIEVSPLQATYARGTTVTLTAVPNEGFHFTEWSGSIADTVSPIQVVMDSNKTIRAHFVGNDYSLTIQAQNGTVDVQPNQPAYPHGTTVTLTATPATGYHFIGWTGSAASVVNPLILTMDSNKTLTANFAPNEYTLTTQAVNGSVAVQPNQTTYLYGTTVTLTAQPADGYRFVEWSGSTTGTLNPLVLIMDSNKSLTAHFATAAPGNVRATDNESTYKVEVSWDTVTSATHYQVWRAESLDGTRTALSGWITTSSFIDDSVVPGVTYGYWVMAAKNAQGSEAGVLSEPDTGSAVAETLVADNYKVTYKGLEPADSGTTGGLKFTATTAKSSLKITALKGKPVGVEKPGVRYLSHVAEIPVIEVTGALAAFSSAAPVDLLKVSGTGKSLTAAAGLRRLEAGQAGTVKVTALKDATASPRTFSRLTVQTSDSQLPLIPLKLSLKGVVAERLTTQQTVGYLKTTTKTYRDKAKVRRVSLAGVGALWRVEPDALDDKPAGQGVDVDGP
ncbi:MAG TPA: InlB B-repeat-containing protein, partial [Candidatus Sumerlaeota bacterium]|nr:InlB B-repeat-containing protein [Candidatus Sumerlaeota bacterium]